MIRIKTIRIEGFRGIRDLLVEEILKLKSSVGGVLPPCVV